MITYEYLKEYVKSHDCILLTSEKEFNHLNGPNSRKIFQYTCKCGSVAQTIVDSYRQSKYKSCKECTKQSKIQHVKDKFGVTNVGQLYKYTYEQVYKYYQYQECELLSTQYENAHDMLEYRCKCGNINISRFCDFKNKNSRCRECGKDSRKETNMKRYGADCPLQNKEIQEKIKETNMERYGCENPFQNEAIKEKIKETNMEKYGVPNACQNPSVMKKLLSSLYKSKPYTLPSGKVVQIMGYEDLALDELLKTYHEDDIVIDNTKIPSFSYIEDSKNRKYFPDIYIPKENKIIEIKSTWTYNIHFEKNKIKFEAVKNAGYSFECWIYDKKKNKIII